MRRRSARYLTGKAASLLSVSERTVRRWVADEKIPFARLPGGQIRIPQGALIASLQGNYDLGAELTALEQRFDGVSEDEIRSAVD